LTVFNQNILHLDILDHLGPVHAGSLCHCHSGIDRVRLTVILNIESAQNTVDIDFRVKLSQAFVVNHLGLNPKNTGHGGGSAQLFQPLGSAGQRETACTSVTGGLPGLLFQGRVEFMAILGQTGQIGGGPEHADKTGGVPGGSAGKLFAFEQHHIADAAFRQMIGDGTADDAAANNNDLRLGWELSFICHTNLSLEFLIPK